VRRETGRRLAVEYERRVAGLVAVIREDLQRQSTNIAARLADVAEAMADDNRLRGATLGDLAGRGNDRPYVLDYAGRAMRLAGLGVLQVQDDSGRIISSGHFRNAFDQVEPVIADGGTLVLLETRTPSGPLLALVRSDSLRIGGRRLTIVGGVRVDAGVVARLGRDTTGVLTVRLEYPGGVLGDTATAGEVVSEALPLGTGRLVVAASAGELAALRASLDRWFAVALAVTAGVALFFAWWVSARLSGPLTALARKTETLDLERLDVDFATQRKDEIGALSRLLAALTGRLRVGAARLREAERRITIGDVARQVNHDVKNGLVPIRNVLRHLGEVAEREPRKLAPVFAERRGTLESGVAYLENLAATYAKLSPPLDGHSCDLNGVAVEVVRTSAETPRRNGLELRTELAPEAPRVAGDAVVVRRILENLVWNAIDSLPDGAGTVTITTAPAPSGARLTVADTGCGMSKTDLDRAFEAFHTTKPGGTGLGLAIVRRLVQDLNGALRVESAPGKGTTFCIDFPGAP
jgi:signal transduction histidine kinase